MNQSDRMKLSRRGFVQAAGTTALGVTAGSALWASLRQRALAAEPGATKVIFFYVPEGCAQQAFWPGGGPGDLNINMSASIDGKNPQSKAQSITTYSSADMGTYCLQPLKEQEQLLTLISGFDNLGRNLEQSHLGAVRAALTGSNGGGGAQGSLDYHLGQHLQGDSVFGSIFSSLFGQHVLNNLTGDFGSPIRTPSGAPGSPTWNPVTTYNQVFPSGIQTEPGEPKIDHRLHARLRALGSTRAHLEAVKCQGGAQAQQRLEAYLASIEKIEEETQALVNADGSPVPEVDVSVDIPDGWTNISSANEYWKNHTNFAKLSKIQIDTTVAALALNRTRVSLMQFSASGNSNGVNGSHYQTLGIQGFEGGTQDHHLGHDPDPVRRRDQARVFRWYYEQLNYLVERLKAIPDGDGVMMDNTLIVCCSEFSMYNHRGTDMPYVLVGNPEGLFKKGVYLDARRNGNQRSHSDFLLGLMRALGMSNTSFGTSSDPYSGFLA